MRFLLALTVLLAIAFGGVVASTSCVIDQRDPADGGGTDGEAGGVFDASDASDATEESDGPTIDLDCGCCLIAVLPGLPPCEGNVAFEVASGDCKVPCEGPAAYVLCEGTCYSACGCELPEGYTLFDAGYRIEPVDAGTKDGDALDASKLREAGEAGRDAAAHD